MKHANANGLSEANFIGNHTQRHHFSKKTKLATSWTHAGWGKVWANPISNTKDRLRPKNTHTHTHTHTHTQTKGQCWTINGELPMVTGKWAMGNCQWSMVNGEWSPANGQKANCQWPLAKGHWPIANGELVMAIWKLWKTNCVCIKNANLKCLKASNVQGQWSMVNGQKSWEIMKKANGFHTNSENV